MAISRAVVALRTVAHRVWRMPRWLAVTVMGGLVCVVLGIAAAGAAASGPVAIYQTWSHRYFSPNGDGQEDTVTVAYCLAAPANVTVTVSDAADHVVRTVESGVSHTGFEGCDAANNYAVWPTRSAGSGWSCSGAAK